MANSLRNSFESANSCYTLSLGQLSLMSPSAFDTPGVSRAHSASIPLRKEQGRCGRHRHDGAPGLSKAFSDWGCGSSTFAGLSVYCSRN